MSNLPPVRRIAPGIVSTVAMIAAMLSATTAHADTIAEDQSAEDIIVTGYRASLANAIAEKKNSDLIVESISARSSLVKGK